MRICVVEFVGRGGMAHYAFQLSRALWAAGADVTLLTDRRYELRHLSRPFRLEPILDLWDPKPSPVTASPGDAEGPASHRPASDAGWRRHLRRLPRAARHYRAWVDAALFLRRHPHDVVLIGDIRFAGDLLGVALLRALRVPLLDVCHNVLPYTDAGAAAGTFRRSAPQLAVYRRIYRRFERVFVHYESNRDLFLQTYGLAPERVVALPHGNEEVFLELAVNGQGLRKDPDEADRAGPGEVPDPPGGLDAGGAAGAGSSGAGPAGGPEPLPLEDLTRDASTRLVVLLGTLARYKGVDVLVSAFRRLRPRCPEARLVIAGFPAPGFDLEELRRALDTPALRDAVALLPRYLEAAEAVRLLESAYVAVFPYRQGFQSGALHLVQTLGVPVVATRIGALPEILRDGETGLLVPPDDPAGLADALERLIAEPELARRLARAGMTDAFGRFGWERPARIVLRECRRVA